MGAIIYGSVCSGIEAASVAWAGLGWQPAFVSEIDPFARAVLAHRFPDVPLHGDFTTIAGGDYGSINVLVGGTPCQSFSIAGLRAGIADERGNLALEFMRLARRLRPEWVVWENVPGVLSSSRGRDFGAIIGALGELGYGVAWRVLDAQHFGVPQRRRRVFVVGCLGGWRGAAAVLFERDCLSRDSAPGRSATADFTCGPLLSSSSRRRGSGAVTEAASGQLVALPIQEVSKRTGASTTDKRAGIGIGSFGDPMFTLQAGAQHGVYQTGSSRAVQAYRTSPNWGAWATGDRVDALTTGTDRTSHIVAHGGGRAIDAGYCVRRLTPRECERLQGFPDDWTLVPYRGKFACDAPPLSGCRQQHGGAGHALDRPADIHG